MEHRFTAEAWLGSLTTKMELENENMVIFFGCCFCNLFGGGL
jgi:hypothetical protein